jgi:hypothetical protein
LPIPGGGSIKLLVDVTLMHRWPERNFSGAIRLPSDVGTAMI